MKITALLCTLFLWSSAFVGIRYALVDYAPGDMALFRFIIASICMAVIYYCRGVSSHLRLIEKLQLLLLGAIGIGLYNYCLNLGELTVNASVASFIIGLIPVCSTLFSVFLLAERVGYRVCLGAVIALLGLLILSWPSMVKGGLKGEILVFIATLSGAFYSTVQKRFLQRAHPIEVTSYIIWGGTLSLGLFWPELLRDVTHASLSSTLCVIYMGVFPAAIAYLCWSYVIQQFPVSKVSLALYAIPLISTALAAVLLHEMPSLIVLVGGIVTILGALLGSTDKFRLKEE